MIVATPRPDDRIRLIVNLGGRNKTVFVVAQRGRSRDRAAIEQEIGICEIKAAPVQVREPFCLIPFKHMTM
ncbi:MAG: hypothetical protein WB611_27000 [Stellaceae bacterium]